MILHDARNLLTALTLHDDPEVVTAAWDIAALLRAIEVDAAVVDGLRLRVADLEARLAATEERETRMLELLRALWRWDGGSFVAIVFDERTTDEVRALATGTSAAWLRAGAPPSTGGDRSTSGGAGAAGAASALTPALWLIEVAPGWQPGRGRWWRPESAGYTDDILRAGLYTEDDARRITSGSNRSRMVAAPAAVVAAIPAKPTCWNCDKPNNTAGVFCVVCESARAPVSP